MFAEKSNELDVLVAHCKICDQEIKRAQEIIAENTNLKNWQINFTLANPKMLSRTAEEEVLHTYAKQAVLYYLMQDQFLANGLILASKEVIDWLDVDLRIKKNIIMITDFEKDYPLMVVCMIKAHFLCLNL